MKRKIFIFLAAVMLACSVSARQPGKGYRGFFEWSNDVHGESYTSMWFHEKETYYDWMTGISTSHGYQFNPNLFVGAGIGFEFYDIAPLFLHVRTDQKFGKFTPFGDLRIGYNAMDNSGLYLSPSIGYRFNWGRKVGINLGLGMTLVTYKRYDYELMFVSEDDWIWNYLGTTRHPRAYFSFRLGIDF